MAKTEVSSIGKYQILDRIATGDAAEIFKARLDGIAGFRRLFAIKRVRPHLARNGPYAQMIEEEARIAGMLNHGNIVQLLDLGRDGGALYLVMEFVDGWSLSQVLEVARQAATPLPTEVVVWMAVQTLKGLEYAHNREVIRDGQPVSLGLIHRDISPSNVLISRQGEVKLTDFGIARASLKIMETRPDLLRRTFDYMSPEGASGRDVTQKSDLFALAVVLYECLTLNHPFRREGEMATLEAIADGVHVPLAEARPDLPEGLIRAIERTLSVDPAMRPGDATALKDEMLAVLHELGAGTSQAGIASWIEETLGKPEPEPQPKGRQLTLDDMAPDDLPDLPEDPERTVPAPLPGAEHEDEMSIGRHPHAEEAGTIIVPGVLPSPPTFQAPQHEDEAEGATVVHRDSALRVEELRAQRMSPFEANEPTRARPDLARALAPADPVPTTEAPPPAPEGPPAWLVSAVAGVVALVIGALLGAVVTVGSVRSGAMLVNPPVLDVRADPGVKLVVSVDGAPMAPGPQQLTPGSHPVKVEVEGASPWEFDLTLAAGEYRVMVITANEVQVEVPGQAPADKNGRPGKAGR